MSTPDKPSHKDDVIHAGVASYDTKPSSQLLVGSDSNCGIQDPVTPDPQSSAYDAASGNAATVASPGLADDKQGDQDKASSNEIKAPSRPPADSGSARGSDVEVDPTNVALQDPAKEPTQEEDVQNVQDEEDEAAPAWMDAIVLASKSESSPADANQSNAERFSALKDALDTFVSKVLVPQPADIFCEPAMGLSPYRYRLTSRGIDTLGTIVSCFLKAKNEYYDAKRAVLAWCSLTVSLLSACASVIQTRGPNTERVLKKILFKIATDAHTKMAASLRSIRCLLENLNSIASGLKSLETQLGPLSGTPDECNMPSKRLKPAKMIECGSQASSVHPTAAPCDAPLHTETKSPTLPRDEHAPNSQSPGDSVALVSVALPTRQPIDPAKGAIVKSRKTVEDFVADFQKYSSIYEKKITAIGDLVKLVSPDTPVSLESSIAVEFDRSFCALMAECRKFLHPDK